MAAPPPSPLGNLVRLHPLSLDDLPSHPSLTDLPSTTSSRSSTSTAPQKPRTRPSLTTFLTALLSEATTFIDHTLPATFAVSSTTKTSPPAIAPVTLLKHTYAASTLSTVPWTTSTVARAAGPPASEAWFARRSRHADAASTGTAAWAEFDGGLRARHSANEQAYTPDVYDAHRVLAWDADTAALHLGATAFHDADLALYEMCHALPFPLRPRVFSVAVATARTRAPGQPDGLVIVQVPVDMAALPQARYSAGRNVGAEAGVQGKRCVRGRYVSVERARRDVEGQVEWVMGTASDAGGWLPMWAQKMGVPGAVVKDVGLFVRWVGGRRGREGV
ncbi:hypothetical protein MMC11_000280 [Xylographa trunciseda]|nr:hypothetical protein [Xylographa trunciseda]